jgi:hypothetical protein
MQKKKRFRDPSTRHQMNTQFENRDSSRTKKASRDKESGICPRNRESIDEGGLILASDRPALRGRFRHSSYVLLATLLDTELGNGRVRGRAREECVLLLLLASGNTRHVAAVALGCTTACTLLLR